MVKNGIIIGFLMVVLVACGRYPKTTFELILPGDDERNVDVETTDGRMPLKFEPVDSLRKASFTLSLSGGEYARVWVGDLPFTVWVEVGKPWNAMLKWNELHFEGYGAEVNRYLNTRFVHQFYFNDYYRMGEGEFREKLREVVNEREAILRERKLDIDFTVREMKRIQWLKNYHLALFVNGMYSRSEKEELSEECRSELQSIIVEDTTCWGIPEYPEAMKRALQIVVQGGDDSYSRLLRVLEMATEKYKDRRLVEYVVNKSVMEYVRYNGMENTTEMDSIFRAVVRRWDYVESYNKLYEANRKLFKGQPAISFSLEDTMGKKVSLSDLRGKYVYVDMWATWCGPCRAEIPYLEKLEKKLKGRNICFVSISCDHGQKEWKDYVRNHELGGIQLYLGYNKDFMEAILCKGIPRFMLIDREGNYINANMSRPSEPETLEILESLPGL